MLLDPAEATDRGGIREDAMKARRIWSAVLIALASALAMASAARAHDVIYYMQTPSTQPSSTVVVRPDPSVVVQSVQPSVVVQPPPQGGSVTVQSATAGSAYVVPPNVVVPPSSSTVIVPSTSSTDIYLYRSR